MSRKPAKTQHGSTTKPKRNNAPTAARPAGSTLADLQEQVGTLTRELAEARKELVDALEQQTATADVLKVVSRATFDLQSVLESLLERAVRLCAADRGLMYRQDGDVYRVAASFGHSPEWLEIIEQYPIHKDRTSATGRAVLDRRVVHIHDILADREYRWAEDLRSKEEMHRTILAVPIVRQDTIIGVIVIRRTRVRPFTRQQIDLVTTFADQAVIAIENTWLINELRQRTDDLSGSLQQQTATAEVLKVISRSTFDLETVLQTLVESAAQLCEAEKGTITRKRGDAFYRVKAYGFSREFMEYIKDIPIRPERGTAHGRALLEGKIIHIHDVLNDPGIHMGQGTGIGRLSHRAYGADAARGYADWCSGVGAPRTQRTSIV
jgi:GAF domain-containing protein